MGAVAQGTEQRFDALFTAEQRVLVRNLLLEACGHNLPFLRKIDSVKMDRFRFGALQVGAGDWEKLHAAAQLAQKDWRDLLVAAGFANNPRRTSVGRPQAYEIVVGRDFECLRSPRDFRWAGKLT
jgi:hypothetical protein